MKNLKVNSNMKIKMNNKDTIFNKLFRENNHIKSQKVLEIYPKSKI